ncbi:hypothetical protein LOAG_01708 [Loa loa]|uniref:Uncharacterized protein n=1 Tax=Loa loa TaxID=7209 RepID=A0A1S0U854_LOALO|nr:hypothetical protein LOAG_01708 [Loa loa]EFO26777.1 hypothetical protein LOAG_01708 [Loa loa]
MSGKKEGKVFKNSSKVSQLTIPKDHMLEESMITSASNSWKNISKEEGKEEGTVTINNKLIAEDLSSVIGLMAYGSLKNDIDSNLGKKYDSRASRQHAGRSVNNFDMLSSSLTYTDYIKNAQEIPQITIKNHDNTMDDSISKDEIEKYSENTSEITSDNDRSDIFASNSFATRSDIAIKEQNAKLENRSRKNYRKNMIVAGMEMSTNDDESFLDVSPSDRTRSTKSSASSEARTTNITGSEITQQSNDQSMVSLSQRVITDTNWISDNTVSNDRNSNDSYDSTQQNSTFQWNELQPNSISQTFLSIPQSNSVLRMSPLRHKLSTTSLSSSSPSSSLSSLSLSSLSFTHTIHTFSNGNVGQNSKCAYANSIHLSDFEIPSYLNAVPTSTYSQQQFTYAASKAWIRSQQINDIRGLSPTVSESTQTHTSNDRINSKSTRSAKILPIYQLEKMPRRFSHMTNVDKFKSKSFCQTEKRAQICHQSKKYASILSTIPLTSQSSTVSERSGKCCINSGPSIPYKFPVENQVKNFRTNFKQSNESSPETNTKFVHPKLSEMISTNSEFSEIPNCSNLGKKLKLSDMEEVQMEQSSSIEGLKMKMNMVLISSKRYQSSDEYIGIGEQQVDQENNPSGSILSLNSKAAITTYESTQNLPTTEP